MFGTALLIVTLSVISDDRPITQRPFRNARAEARPIGTGLTTESIERRPRPHLLPGQP
jgi:hypothetical protein